MKQKKAQKQETKKIAEERVVILLKQIKQRPAYSQRYVDIIIRICKKARLAIPAELKDKYCPNCHRFWSTASVRIKDGKPVKICKCGRILTKR